MTFWKQALLASLILAAGALAYIYLWQDGGDASEASGGAQRPAGAPTRVIVTPAVYAPTRVRLEAVGTAEAARSATIHAAVAGEVTRIAFTPNQRIKKGNVLLELNQRSERLAVDLARVRLKDARQILARYERTRGTGAVAATTVDQARTTLAAAQIQLKQAQAALNDRTVRAPFDGHIGLTGVDVGDRIDADDAIATLDDRAALMIAFAVPELYHGRIGVGQSVTVRPWAADAAAVMGEIIDVDSRIDAATRSFTVRARTPNPGDRLRPGMGFAVGVELTGKSYLMAPEAAVQWGAGGAYLWIVRDGKAKRMSVNIVERQPGVALVEAPVEAGEPIVVEGIQRVREGRAVAPEPAPAAGS